MRVMILGAGPSGMMAAHAALQLGCEVKILDQDPQRTRTNAGVFMLHDSCDLALRPIEVRQEVLGLYQSSRQHDSGERRSQRAAELYQDKVYGQMEVSGVSVLDAIGTHVLEMYSTREAMKHLWTMYGHLVEKRFIARADLTIMRDAGYKVISTIPAPSLFTQGVYRSAVNWVTSWGTDGDEAFMYYHVSPEVAWHRYSTFDGMVKVEYGSKHRPLDMLAHKVLKVTSVEGRIEPEGSGDWLLLAGRYGSWDKGALLHTTYERVFAGVSDWIG